MNPLKIYKKLLEYFGPQGWWPIFDKKTGRCEYRNHKILSERDKFEICVGAILTQNTAWKNVEKVLANLSEGGCLFPEKIIAAKNIAKLIKPAGYYNQKAKKLKIFSKYWLGTLGDQVAPSQTIGDLVTRKLRRDELLSLWGIGPETADSMLLYASKSPVFVVDAYTKRLCCLLGVKFDKYDEYRAFFESNLPRRIKLYNEYHALIVAWGKLYGNKATKEEAIKLIN